MSNRPDGRFLLTRPLRDVTPFSASLRLRPGFLLTRPLRDVTQIQKCIDLYLLFLLTRPLRDVTEALGRKAARYVISTHTPLAGRDNNVVMLVLLPSQFLLTRPLRDVTLPGKRIL